MRSLVSSGGVWISWVIVQPAMKECMDEKLTNEGGECQRALSFDPISNRIRAFPGRTRVDNCGGGGIIRSSRKGEASHRRGRKPGTARCAQTTDPRCPLRRTNRDRT